MNRPSYYTALTTQEYALASQASIERGKMWSRDQSAFEGVLQDPMCSCNTLVFVIGNSWEFEQIRGIERHRNDVNIRGSRLKVVPR